MPIDLYAFDGSPFDSFSFDSFSAASSIALSLVPQAASLAAGGTLQLAATVSSGSVSWSVSGNGSVSGTGLFTSGGAGTCVVTATSTVDPAVSASATILTVAAGFFELDLLAYLNQFGLTVYPGHIPETVPLPAMSFLIVSADHINRLAGAAGIGIAHVQIAVSSTRYMDVGQVSEQLRLALQGYTQRMMGNTWIGVVLLTNQFTQYEKPVDGGDDGTHSKINEYIFHYQEQVPVIS